VYQHAFEKNYTHNPGSFISIPTGINTPGADNYRFTIVALAKDGGWDNPKTFTLAYTNGDIKIEGNIVFPKIIVTKYPKILYQGDFADNVDFARLPSSSDYYLYAQVHNTENGYKKAGWIPIDDFPSSGSMNISIPIWRNAEPINKYKIKITCVSRSYGWKDVAANYVTEKDIVILH